MEKRQEQQMVRVEKTGGQMRWMAITALFLTIGVILRLFSPSAFGISPNWLIAMYCLAILVVRPDWKQTVGIGVVAGVVCVASSKAIFPWANILSEPLGAVACYLITKVPVKENIAKFFIPLLSTFVGTLVSGFVFVTITKVVMVVPMQVYLYGMLPVVLTVGVVNCIVAQVLYFPAVRLLERKDFSSERTDQR